MNFFTEILSDALPTIEKYAPLIATGLAGPMAGNIVSLIETVFNGSIKDPEDLVGKILGDPKNVEKLKQCNEHISNWDDTILSLWNRLGRPCKLSIEWPSDDKSTS